MLQCDIMSKCHKVMLKICTGLVNEWPFCIDLVLECTAVGGEWGG